MSILRNSFFFSGDWILPWTSDVDNRRPAHRGSDPCLVSHPGVVLSGGANIKQFLLQELLS